MSPSRSTVTNLLILGAVSLTFCVYFPIGMAFSVLPRFAHEDLACSAPMVGVIVGAQYLATLLSRTITGPLADTIGARNTVIWGMIGSVVGGILLALCTVFDATSTAIAILLVARLLQGTSESLVATGATLWGIGRVGSRHATTIMSMNGVACYTALATGAPGGVILDRIGGLPLVAGVTVLFGGAGLALALILRKAPLSKGVQMNFGAVLWRVLPPGLGLLLGGLGFGVISAFIVLYHASRGWSGGALSLTAFAVCFIAVRLLFTGLIDRFGGYRVVAVAGLVETLGLIVLATAGGPIHALLGSALTGSGFALFFPALGFEAISRVSAASRGAAVGVYTVFVDISLGISGPAAGFVIEKGGYPVMFLLTAVMPIVASAMAWRAARRSAAGGTTSPRTPEAG